MILHIIDTQKFDIDEKIKLLEESKKPGDDYQIKMLKELKSCIVTVSTDKIINNFRIATIGNYGISIEDIHRQEEAKFYISRGICYVINDIKTAIGKDDTL